MRSDASVTYMALINAFVLTQHFLSSFVCRRDIPKKTSDVTRVTIEPFDDHGYASDTQNSARSINATTQNMPVKCVELCTETELVEPTLEHEYHSKTFCRPLPATPPPDSPIPVRSGPEAECASPSEEKDEAQQTPPNTIRERQPSFDETVGVDNIAFVIEYSLIQCLPCLVCSSSSYGE